MYKRTLALGLASLPGDLAISLILEGTYTHALDGTRCKMSERWS